jgi:hypothetical protein
MHASIMSSRFDARFLLPLVLIVLALSACDPYFPSSPDTADVNIEVGAKGTARVDVHLPANFPHDRKQLGEKVARAVFPHASSVRATLTNKPGFLYPTVEVTDAYRPGHHVVLTIDATTLSEVLSADGLSTTALTVCGPFVPLTMTATSEPNTTLGRCKTWKGAPGPSVTMDMRPSALRWWAEVGIIVLAFAGDIAAFALLTGTGVTTRRRIVGGSLGVVAILLCAVGFATRTQADNLAVLGQASGTLLSAAHLVILLLLPLTVISVAAALIALIRRPRDGRDAVRPQGPVPPQ